MEKFECSKDPRILALWHTEIVANNHRLLRPTFPRYESDPTPSGSAEAAQTDSLMALPSNVKPLRTTMPEAQPSEPVDLVKHYFRPIVEAPVTVIPVEPAEQTTPQSFLERRIMPPIDRRLNQLSRQAEEARRHPVRTLVELGYRRKPVATPLAAWALSNLGVAVETAEGRPGSGLIIAGLGLASLVYAGINVRRQIKN